MSQSDNRFSPQTIDEQIAYLASREDQRWIPVNDNQQLEDALDSRLIHDLYNLSQSDEQRLAQTRSRLATAYEEHINSKTAGTAVVETSIGQQPTQKVATVVARAGKAKLSQRQRFVRIVCGLVALLLIGSVLAIFTFNNLRPNQNPVVQPTATATVPTKSDPTSYYKILNDKDLVRINTSEAKIVWRYSLPSSEEMVDQLVVDGDTVYVTTPAGVYAFNSRDGSIIWKQIVSPDLLIALPVLVNHILYVSDEHNIYALRSSDGRMLRTYESPFANGYFQPIIVDNILYVNRGMEIATIDLTSGKLLWKKQIPHNHEARLVNFQVDEDMISFTLSEANVGAYIVVWQASTGNELWKSADLSNGMYIYQLQQGVVYYSVFNTNILHAYDVRAGKESWQKDFGGSMQGITTLDNNTLCLEFDGQDNSFVYHTNGFIAIDTQQGKVKGQYPGSLDHVLHGKQGVGLMTINNGIVYLDSSYGGKNSPQVFDYTAITATGKVLWHVTLKDLTPLLSPAD